jgi:16S rRNA (uracil1498-N3)-methyltransferase
MRIPRIYLPLHLEVNHSVELNEHAFQHTVKVLRMKQDSKLVVFDGKGYEYSASLQQINKKNAFIKIDHIIHSAAESKLSIHLGLGISKGDRMDFAIQKAVELGVTQITPLFTEHCVVNLDEKRMTTRLMHWQGIIVSAAEQSGRTVLPLLNSAMTLNDWSKTIDQTCFVMDPLASKTLNDIVPESSLITLVVGPEGGLSAKEIAELQKKKNFHAIKFGPRILRTETAAVSAVTAIQLLWGDLL